MLEQKPGQDDMVETRSGCLGQEPGQRYGDGNQIRVLGQEPGQGDGVGTRSRCLGQEPGQVMGWEPNQGVGTGTRSGCLGRKPGQGVRLWDQVTPVMGGTHLPLLYLNPGSAPGLCNGFKKQLEQCCDKLIDDLDSDLECNLITHGWWDKAWPL